MKSEGRRESEIRRPKTEGRRKAEGRRPKTEGLTSRAVNGSGARSALLDEFLADYDRRISAGEKQTTEASREYLRRMRPVILLLAENDPDWCDRFLRRWLGHIHGKME